MSDTDELRYLKEIAARGKRIETRLTRYLASIGFDSGAHVPEWVDGAVHLPRPSASFQDILAVIPAGWLAEVADVSIMHDGKLLGVLTIPQEEQEENEHDSMA